MTPTTWTVAILLSAAALGLIAAAIFAFRNRGRADLRTDGRTVVQRAASYAAIAIALALAVAAGPMGLTGFVAILGMLGLWEWARVTELPIHHRIALLLANAVLVVAIYTLGVDAAPWLIGGLVLTGLLWPVIRVDTGRAVRDLGFATVGFLLIAVMLAHGIALAHERGEAGVVLFAALAVGCAGSDVGAFLIGRRLGGTPLAFRLSPAKTRAGLLGNVLGAVIGLLPFTPALIDAFDGPGSSSAVSIGYLLLFVAVVAVGSVWGDLFESAVKRESGVKDAGHWLPGFGGILDRMDSLLLTLPLAYWSFRLVDVAGFRL